MTNFFDNLSLLTVIWKWKKHLIIVGVVTVILAAVFSAPYFITPLYKSQGRVYPINTSSYSEESESEQLLEILSSSDLKREMIDVFKLNERYDVRSDDPFYNTKILKEYNDHVTSKKTEYETIEIAVLDAEPQVASNMVDSLIAFYNRKVQELRKQKYQEQAVSYSNDLQRKLVSIDSVSVKMETLRKEYGLLDYEIQTEQLTSGYVTALAEGARPSAVNDIEARMNNLEEKGGEYFLLQRQMEALEIQRDTINRRLDKALSLANKEESYAMVVESPFPADKKSYPTRWLIVLASLLATEFLALLTVLAIDNFCKSKA